MLSICCYLRRLADNCGDVGKDLGPFERVLCAGNLGNNNGVLDGELRLRFVDRAGDQAGTDVLLLGFRYSAAQKSAWFSFRILQTILVGRFSPVFIHTLLQGDDSHPSELYRQRTIQVGVLIPDMLAAAMRLEALRRTCRSVQ